MKYIIAGGRDFHNVAVLARVMLQHIRNIDEVISGDAPGADYMGAQWAKNKGILVKHFPAQWDQYGKSAGFIRNAEMGDYADALIAFWDGKSKGTAHMIKTMLRQNKPVWAYDYEGNKY